MSLNPLVLRHSATLRRARRRVLAAAFSAAALLGGAGLASAAPLESIGSYGSGPGQFSSGNFLAVDGAGNLYAADRDSDRRVQVFDADGTFLTSWSSEGGGGMAVASDGTVYVSTITSQITRYTSSGVVLNSWVLPNSLFNLSVPLAVDGVGRVYALSANAGTIFRFSPAGEPLTSWSIENASSQGAGTLAAAVDGTVFMSTYTGIFCFSPDGIPLGRFAVNSGEAFQGEAALAVDEHGDVFAADESGRVHRFDPSGRLIASLDITPVGLTAPPRQFGAAARNGHVYVAQNGSTSPVARIADLDTRMASAAITASAPLALSGQAVTLDASASSVLLSSIADYAWDLDGDGSFETDTGTTPTVQRSYSEAGTRSVGVRVTSDGGGTDVARVALETRLAPPPGVTGVSINNGARFTNDPEVRVRVIWRPLSSDLVISNDGGFAAARTVPVAEEIPWTLDSSGPERLPKTIYVRFGAAGELGHETYQDDIILDQTAPVVSSASVVLSTGTQITAGPRATVIRLDARDGLSGLKSVQFANNRSRPMALRPYAARVRHTGVVPRFVRVRDRADNFSPWRVVQGARDRTAPRVSALHATRENGRLRLAFRLSEPATVSGRVTSSTAGKPLEHPIAARRLAAGVRSIRISGFSAGDHRLRLVLRDAAGNRRVVSRSLRLD